MKKTAIYIVIILLSGLLMCIAGDQFLQRGFEKSDDDVIGKLNEIINDSNYYDVVCFGSSRALAHFNPTLAGNELNMSALNAGVNGACIIDINLLLKTYLLYRKPPKIVIMHVDDFSFETDRLSELPRYFPYIDNPIVYNSLKPFNETVTYVHYFHFLRVMYYYDLLKWISIKSWLGIKPRVEYKLVNGYRVNNSKWNDHWEEGLARRIDIIKGLHPKIEAEKPGIPLFMEILDMCKEQNIRLVFSSSPIVRGDLNKLYENTESQVIEYSKGYDVSFHWMHKEDWGRETYFYDYLHMNSLGADRYTKSLCDFIKNN